MQSFSIKITCIVTFMYPSISSFIVLSYDPVFLFLNIQFPVPHRADNSNNYRNYPTN